MDTSTFALIIIIFGAIFLIGGFFVLIIAFNYKAGHSLREKQKAENIRNEPPPEPLVDESATKNQAASAEVSSSTINRGAVFGIKKIYFPLIILGFSIIATLIFLPQLSGELAYRFSSDGEPVSQGSAGLVISICLAAQAALILFGWLNGYVINRIGASTASSPIHRLKTHHVASTITNLVGLPQIIIAFMMIYFFSFNVSGVQLMPIWLFIAIVMLSGIIFIAYNFIKIMKLK